MARWSIFEYHRWPPNTPGRQIHIHLNTIGDSDEGDTAVHAIAFAIAGHCALNPAGTPSSSVDRQQQGFRP